MRTGNTCIFTCLIIQPHECATVTTDKILGIRLPAAMGVITIPARRAAVCMISALPTSCAAVIVAFVLIRLSTAVHAPSIVAAAVSPSAQHTSAQVW
jgi:hypothetical protein